MSKAQKKEAVEKTVAVITAEQNKVVEGLKTWSAKIRYLNDQGYTRSEIAALLGKRYQHVRNVLITPINKDEK